jgi:hypothetical protein
MDWGAVGSGYPASMNGGLPAGGASGIAAVTAVMLSLPAIMYVPVAPAPAVSSTPFVSDTPNAPFFTPSFRSRFS